MDKISLKDWLVCNPDADMEASYYRLLNVVNKIEGNKYEKLERIKKLLIEIECAHVSEFISSFEQLHKIKMGKLALIVLYGMVKYDKTYDLSKFAKREIWNNIKIESSTAI